MNANEIRQRTKIFAVNVIRLVERLPQSQTAYIIGNQLIRCGTSVGANYHAACRAKSPSDFISKMGIVAEEADESVYWMELLMETGLISREALAPLFDEANQLLAITCASIKTASANKATMISGKREKDGIRHAESS